MKNTTGKMTNYRWVICAMLFLATTVNYMDRQVLSLTWADFIAPEFHWTNSDYGSITGLFSVFYAIAMLLAGRFVDWMDTKKGYLWSIGIWSVGACLHALCGIFTSGILTGKWFTTFEGALESIRTVSTVSQVVTVSVTLFVLARLVLALGEAGNFPAAIKATAEYFPKRDRAFATSVFNAGAAVGALFAPVSIPFIAKAWGWEMAFLIIGALGFLWMGAWVFIYKKPEDNPHMNQAERDYANSDMEEGDVATNKSDKKMSFRQAFRHKQTWAFAFGKFMTDGVWWFFLFWTPAYLKDVYGMSSTQSAPFIFILYAITMLSLLGGYLPKIFVEKKGMEPYAGRMRAMLIFAFIPLLVLAAQPLGHITPWIPVIIIGIAGAAHQSWSANIFTTVSDMFPKYAVATITGIGGMAGGIGSFLINKGSGVLFDFSESNKLQFLGFEGIRSGYMIVFSICAVAYLIGWIVMKSLVPKYTPIKEA